MTLNGVLRLIGFMLLVACIIPSALFVKTLFPRHAYVVPRCFHSVLLKIIGIRLRVVGVPSLASPTLFVANHSSYLDIPVLGSMLTGAFVAKAEVERWPLFGFLSKLQNTIFIERKSNRATEQRSTLETHLAQRLSLILFPEGTSSDGLQALPFKSSLFSIVKSTDSKTVIQVQPISITCISLNGHILRPDQRASYGWYGEMTLAPHLWNAFKQGHFLVEVRFHDILLPADYPNRKALANTCQEAVARGIEQSLKTNLGV